MINSFYDMELFNSTDAYMRKIKAGGSLGVALTEFKNSDGLINAIGAHTPEMVKELDNIAKQVKAGNIYASIGSGGMFEYSVWFMNELKYDAVKPLIDDLKSKKHISHNLI